MARVRINQVNQVRLPILLEVSLTEKTNFSLSPFASENLVSRDGFGSPVPRHPAHLHLRLNLVLTYGFPPEFRGGVYLFMLYRHMPSGQSRVYRVKHLRTDGVYCRESAGTGSVNPKVVPVTGAALAGHHGPINMRLSYPHPLLV